MSMFRRFLVIGLAAATIAHGQDNNRNGPQTGSIKNPDDDWTAITTLVASARTTQTAPGPKTRAQIEAAAVQAANLSKQVAQAAKGFCSSFPRDPRVPEARKIEALSLLQSVRPTDVDRGQYAFNVATVYRSDTSNPLKDRISVAGLMEARQFSVTNNGKQLADNTAEHEATADRLRGEFGDAPEVYDYYLGVIDATDTENARRIAQRIVQLPAPDSAKRQAQVTIDRHALLGKPFDLALTAHDNRRERLASPNKLTVLFVWSPRHGNTQWPALAASARAAPKGTRWVYLALDATEDEAQVARNAAPHAGAYCFEPGGQASLAAKSLKLRRVPFVYVIDAKGELAAYGRPAELPALFAALNL